MTKLLPCPFCGSDRITVQNIRDGQQTICKDCHSEGAPEFNGKYGPEETWERAVSAWNLRAHNSDIAEPVAWRVSHGGGVTIWNVESNAKSNAKLTGGVIEPLYLASPPANEVTRPMIVAAMQEFNELTDRYISDDAMRRILIKALTNRTPDDE